MMTRSTSAVLTFLSMVAPFVVANNPEATVLTTTLPLRNGRSAVAYVPGGDYIYSFGGYSGGGIGPGVQVLRFTISNTQMDRVAVLPYDLYDSATALDDEGNIYVVGGSCGIISNRCPDRPPGVYLRFNTSSHIVEEVSSSMPPVLPNFGSKVVSYQRDPASPAYIAASLMSGGSTGIHLMKMDIMEDGDRDIVPMRSYTVPENFTVTAMDVIDEDVFLLGYLASTNFRVYQFHLHDESLRVYATLSPPQHEFTVIYGSRGIVHLLPTSNQGVIDTYDIRQNLLTQHNLNNYPEALSTLRLSTYVYIEELDRVYIFGGFTSSAGYLSTIWTIDMSPTPTSTTGLPTTEMITLETTTSFSTTTTIPTSTSSTTTKKPTQSCGFEGFAWDEVIEGNEPVDPSRTPDGTRIWEGGIWNVNTTSTVAHHHNKYTRAYRVDPLYWIEATSEMEFFVEQEGVSIHRCQS